MPPTKERINKVVRDGNTIRDGILGVTLGWASLENTMAVVLERIINDENHPIGFAIYFAAASAETRFEIVDRALWAFTVRSKYAGPLSDGWKKISAKLTRARRVRNKIIHGNITTVGGGNRPDNHVRLTPAIFDVSRMTKQRRDKQLPGLSAHDVVKAAQEIDHLQKSVSIFSEMIAAARANNQPELHEKWNELEAHHRNA